MDTGDHGRGRTSLLNSWCAAYLVIYKLGQSKPGRSYVVEAGVSMVCKACVLIIR